uniref:Uncharacterized protein n=1 Tax=Zooxanthella nutricula TaxID=1333877 RepID=A0A7S2NNV9_9DINO
MPSACLFLAILLYFLPMLLWECIPGLRQCAKSELVWTSTKIGIDWVWVEPHSMFWLVPALAIICLAVGAVAVVALWRMPPYAGRMLVVPNRESDIYARLWCVYEVFTALRLGVHVKVANTLASAGLGSSEQARCSCDEDAQRIRGEIVDEGHTFAEIDRAVRLLFWRRLWSVARTCVVSTLLLAMCMTEALVNSGFPPAHREYSVMAMLFASAVIVMLVYFATRWNQGVVSIRVVLAMSVGLIALGALGTVFSDPQQEIWFAITSGACPMMLLAGISMLMLLAGTWAQVRCHPVVEVVFLALAIWLLNAQLMTKLLNAVWSWRHGLPTQSFFSHWVPDSFATCPVGAHPYPCAVRIAADLAQSLLPACLLVAQATTWGVRPRRLWSCNCSASTAKEVSSPVRAGGKGDKNGAKLTRLASP